MKKEINNKIDSEYYWNKIISSEKLYLHESEDWTIDLLKNVNARIKSDGDVRLISKTQKKEHSFEKSIYFNNFELFQKDMNEKFENIDALSYFETFVLSCESKNYKYTNWKATFWNWISKEVKANGSYKKISVKKEIGSSLKMKIIDR